MWVQKGARKAQKGEEERRGIRFGQGERIVKRLKTKISALGSVSVTSLKGGKKKRKNLALRRKPVHSPKTSKASVLSETKSTTTK